jgi:hypothetical protein
MTRQNVGNIDRWVRLILGACLLSLVIFAPHTAWGWIGLIPLATAWIGQCPVYSVFGWRTRLASTEKKA